MSSSCWVPCLVELCPGLPAVGFLVLADVGPGSLISTNVGPGPPAIEFLVLNDLGPIPLATGFLALSDLGPGFPVTGSLALTDFGPDPPVTGSFALADLGPGPPAAGSPALVDFGSGPPATESLADTDSDSSASVFLVFLSLVYNFMFLGYFALCDLVPASPTAKSLTLWRSVKVLVYTECVSCLCLVTSTAPTVMPFFLESLHIPEFSESITHADPVLEFPVISILTFWVFLNSVHASIYAQFILQVASVLERSISGFLFSPDLAVSSGYTTPFIFSVYLTPSDFNLPFCGIFLYLLVCIFSALYFLPSLNLDLFWVCLLNYAMSFLTAVRYLLSCTPSSPLSILVWSLVLLGS